MTYEELKEIKLRLDKWREERHLSYESQQKGFMPNILEEIREYYLAQDDDERVAELCDVIIFSLNANELEKFNLNSKEMASLRHLMGSLASMISDNFTGLKLDFNGELAIMNIQGLMQTCINIIKRMGYNPYECLKEKVKEIESRTGHYDESLGKFIKDKGAYTQEEAKNLTYKEFGDDFEIVNTKENEEYFYLWITTTKEALQTTVKKWHKAKMIKNA